MGERKKVFVGTYWENKAGTSSPSLPQNGKKHKPPNHQPPDPVYTKLSILSGSATHCSPPWPSLAFPGLSWPFLAYFKAVHSQKAPPSTSSLLGTLLGPRARREELSFG